MSVRVEASPDSVLAVAGGIIGGSIVAVAGFVVWVIVGNRNERRRKAVEAAMRRHPAGKGLAS